MIAQRAVTCPPRRTSGGGPNQPDFTITLPDGQTVNFDITTNNERGIARHLQRPYGPGLQIIPYERPDGLVPFPPRR